MPQALAIRLFVVGALLAVAAAASFMFISSGPSTARADSEPENTLTFEGNVGGGTIRLTTTADRSAIVRAQVIGGFFPPCSPNASGLSHMSPPAPVTGDSFSFSMAFRFPIHGFSFTGSFVDANTMQGTATFGFLIPGLSCNSVNVAWTATGPAETAPGPNDLAYLGSVKEGAGGITVVTDPARENVTAVILDGVSNSPCTDALGPLEVVAPFLPPEPIAPDGSFDVRGALAPGFRGFTVTGSLSGTTMAGTLSLTDVSSGDGCYLELPWNAAQKGGTPPPPTPTLPAIPIFQKIPALSNLFLTQQGAKLPPSTCLAGTDAATIAEQLSVPIPQAPDPKDPAQDQQLGAFEFEVQYDHAKVCVDITPGAAAASMVCIVEDSVSKPDLEGVARIGCVTLGKNTFPDTSTPA
ncbi:MAG: hypothetical protein Q8S13_11255, partial [Dehalococcoidia bacterium]|nr:hypothetical protein [Dehalococcoidia bacterium]